ncbi:ATP-binding cassette domain-containing protein [Leucothrix arctica]|uniref:ATP-binding protein Uup n=1 Tax=Leucothrix arctica TaxID=1481894 RepID=A0A317CQS7_9GAMM|nr:ATP-binding cassette domain-containing protein [Leucothrix arctica]PWQ98760.1 ABC transporter ATP-binding protein [Leucothrix arctica]
MPLLTLQNVQLSYGGPALLDGVDLTIEPGERICLIGRNGAGKSSLMKIIKGTHKPDSGNRVLEKGTVITQLEQEVPHHLGGTVYDVVADGLSEVGALLKKYNQLSAQLDNHDEKWMNDLEKTQQKLEACDGWKFGQNIDSTISLLKLDPAADFTKLSGGVKRRVLLARALVQDPDILLLDEPTNHLDISVINWMEEFLLSYKATVVFITHDRSFLRNLATRIVELDRGRANSWPGDYDNFLRRKQEELEAESAENARFEKKLAQEEIWIRKGIKARRTRNEGRVRALKAMRVEHQKIRQVQGKANIQVESGERSGKRVVEAENISYNPADKNLVNNFSTLVQRGDRIGLIGPNGVGKTTLLRLLLGKIEPDSGTIKLGTGLEVAYFDQLRDQLDENSTVKASLDRGSDNITVNGKTKHVISYLQDFLFTPERANSPVNALSGGERNRLLLAKLFIKPANILVLDEPTNDLDVETLELLEDLLTNYEGTVLIVSHDRTFINNLVTSCMIFEGNGVIREYVGSYDDCMEQQAERVKQETSKQKTVTNKQKQSKNSAPAASEKKLSFKVQHELDSLPKEIEKLEKKIAATEEEMASAAFAVKDHKSAAAVTDSYQALQQELEQKYARWEELEG